MDFKYKYKYKMPHNLNCKWVLWFHSPVDDDWTLDSYKKVIEISNIEEFWNAFHYINDSHICNSMFFIMRDGIEPIWEDQYNKEGGCWSFKISKKDVYNAWLELGIALCSERITSNLEKSNTINGISISPKKTFCILKIWNNNSEENAPSFISKKIPYIYVNTSIYKEHIKKTINKEVL